MESILESEMQFGPFQTEDIFWIEKSQQYEKKLKPNGIKSCEFILNRGKKLLFVEAKKSCPNEITAETSDEKIEKYNAYISDIVTKMRHSLTSYASFLLKRYDSTGIPDNLMKTDLSKKNIVLVLVVKTAEKEWLIPLQEKLNNELRQESRIWRDVKIFAINEETAKEKQLVV